MYLFSVLLRYNIWLLDTFINSSCDIKINIIIVHKCCRNLVVRGLKNENKMYIRGLGKYVFHR